eukprot:GSChrysophyteH1.ASY1.ANO1.1097.1 assembled CDS
MYSFLSLIVFTILCNCYAQDLSTREILKSIQTQLAGLNRLNDGSKELALAQERLAIDYSKMGAMEESAKYFEMAGKTLETYGQPSKESYFNAGMTYLQLQSYAKAEKNLKRSVKIEPLFRPAHIKLASLYRDIGNSMKVQRHLQYAIQISPNIPDAYMYLADTYNNIKQFALAIEQYQKALSLSGHPDAIATIACNMGDTYMNLKQTEKALEAYARGKRQVHASPSARSCSHIGYLYAAMEHGQWQDHEVIERECMDVARDALGMGKASPPTSQSPYRLLFHMEPALSLITAVKWSSALQSQVVPKSPLPDADAENVLGNQSEYNPVLNIGYLSRRHHNYPGTQLMLRIFGSHDRNKVKIAAYSTGPDDESRYREVIKNESNIFHDLISMDDEKSAKLILSTDQVNILIDYDGSHDFNNINIPLPFNPTRRQLQPGKVPEQDLPPPVDFLMVDNIVVPPDSSAGRAYSEHLVYLPGGCYQPQDEYQAISVADEENDENILSGTESIWLACLNRISKITPTAFASFMQLLQVIPRSKLILLEDEEAVNKSLRRYATSQGISSERILFFPRADKSMYMDLLRVSNLYLDTRIYGSHTVASDAMYQGLPVLTIPGSTFASRVSASLNTAMKTEELITHSERSWLASASRILRNQKQSNLQQALRKKVGNNARSSDHSQLFNSKAFAYNLERTYQSMYELGRMSKGGSMEYHLFFESSLRG